MLVPARIIASEGLLAHMDAGVFEQVSNVACLPGILKYAFCMPDGHWGYGFPIGGVAAMDPDSGVISPGGIGFDINCGMRLVLTTLTEEEVRPHLHQLVDLMFARIPTGVGCSGFVRCSRSEFRQVLEKGFALVPGEGLCLGRRPGDDRGGRLFRRCRSRQGQRQGHRARLRPDRHPRFGQPLLRDPGGEA
jgi:RNA-splicing ligase RtcB